MSFFNDLKDFLGMDPEEEAAGDPAAQAGAAAQASATQGTDSAAQAPAAQASATQGTDSAAQATPAPAAGADPAVVVGRHRPSAYQNHMIQTSMQFGSLKLSDIIEKFNDFPTQVADLAVRGVLSSDLQEMVEFAVVNCDEIKRFILDQGIFQILEEKPEHASSIARFASKIANTVRVKPVLAVPGKVGYFYSKEEAIQSLNRDELESYALGKLTLQLVYLRTELSGKIATPYQELTKEEVEKEISMLPKNQQEQARKRLGL